MVVAVLGLALNVIVPAAPALAHESYGPPSGGSFTFQGRGWGHGRGMSQWGAFRAAGLGNTARQITDFYYAGSTLGLFGDRGIRVLLQATENDRLMRFQNQAGLTATVYASDQVTS